MSDDLCVRLTALSRSEHSDLSVAAEAVEEIGRLRSALAECADDLARRVDEDWPAAMMLGGSHAKYHKEDMAPVIRARALLAGNGKAPA